MFLNDYISNLEKTINKYFDTETIISSEIKVNAKSDSIGSLKINIIFIDDSKLFIKEYLDLRYGIDKLSYSYHYQDKDNMMIFRYDNAIHKPVLSFNAHKHIKNKVIQYDIPLLEEILEEIIINLI